MGFRLQDHILDELERLIPLSRNPPQELHEQAGACSVCHKEHGVQEIVCTHCKLEKNMIRWECRLFRYAANEHDVIPCILELCSRNVTCSLIGERCARCTGCLQRHSSPEIMSHMPTLVSSTTRNRSRDVVLAKLLQLQIFERKALYLQYSLFTKTVNNMSCCNTWYRC